MSDSLWDPFAQQVKPRLAFRAETLASGVLLYPAEDVCFGIEDLRMRMERHRLIAIIVNTMICGPRPKPLE
jgi:hypothetical protein